MNCEVDNIKAMTYKQLFATLDELKFFSMEGKSTEEETRGKTHTQYSTLCYETNIKTVCWGSALNLLFTLKLWKLRPDL